MGAEATLKMLLLGEDRSASKALKGVGGEAEKQSSHLKNFGKVAAAGLLVAAGAAVAFGKSSVSAYEDAAKESAQLARVTGLTIKQASQLRFAGEETGVSFSSLSKGMQIFSKQQSLATDATLQYEQKMKDATAAGKPFTGHLTGSAKAFAALGIATSNARGKTIPMHQLLGQVADQFKSMPDGPTKTALAMQLFGKGGADMIKTLNKGSEGLKELAAESDRTGNTLKDTDAYKKQLAAQREFHASITGLKIQVGQALMPILTQLFTVLAEKVGPIFQKVTGFVQKHGDLIRKVAPIVLALASALGVAGLATKAFGIVLTLATSPVSLIVLAIIAIGAAFVYAFKHSQPFHDWVMNKLLPALKKLGDWIKTKVLPALKQIGQWIMQHVVPAVAVMVKWWANHVLPIYVKVAQFIFTKLIPAFVKIVAAIVSFVAAAVQKFGEFTAMLERVVGKIAQFVQAVQQKIGQVIGFFVSLPGKVLKAVGNLGSLLFQKGKDLISGLINGIKSVGSNAVHSAIHAITGGLLGRVLPGANTGRAAGIALLAGLVKGITSGKVPLSRALDSVQSYINDRSSQIASLLQDKASVVSTMKGFASSVFGASFDDAEGNAAPPSVQGLLAYQQQQRDQANQTKTDVSKLLKLGLSKDLINQMLSSGSSGVANLHALAGGSVADITQLNALNAQTNRAYSASGVQVGGALYNPQLAQARNDKNAAVAIRRELEKLLHKQDKNTVVELHIDGKVLQVSLLQLKRHNGGKALGLA